MDCILCEKNWNLGVTNFVNEKSPENDPLSTLFKGENYSFQNPKTKQSEIRPIFDIIASQSGAEDLSEPMFKMFPPVILPSEDISHGFPRHFPDNLQNFDNKNTLPIKDGDIDDEDLHKRTWFSKFLFLDFNTLISIVILQSNLSMIIL